MSFMPTVSFLLINMCVFVCMSLHIPCVGVFHGSQRMSDSLKFELYVVMSCVMWMLETEPASFARAVSALDHRTFSPVPSFILF